MIGALLALALQASTTAAAPPKPLPGCASPESRQFDFWIGRWKVTDTNTGEYAGDSLIERLYGGCALRENWTDPQMQGGSLNVYDAREGRWRQFWVDQSGVHREFVGGMIGGDLVMVARVPRTQVPGTFAEVRLSFTPNPDGSVRQHSQVSLDGGKTWTERYDYTYRRTAS